MQRLKRKNEVEEQRLGILRTFQSAFPVRKACILTLAFSRANVCVTSRLFPGRGPRLLPSAPCPDLLQGLPNLQTNKYRTVVCRRQSRDRVVNLATLLNVHVRKSISAKRKFPSQKMSNIWDSIWTDASLGERTFSQKETTWDYSLQNALVDGSTVLPFCR
jgi:hypothetical protein